jgi:hypothetical protein
MSTTRTITALQAHEEIKKVIALDFAIKAFALDFPDYHFISLSAFRFFHVDLITFSYWSKTHYEKSVHMVKNEMVCEIFPCGINNSSLMFVSVFNSAVYKSCNGKA